MDSELNHRQGNDLEQSCGENKSPCYAYCESAVCSQCGTPFPKTIRARNASSNDLNARICPACMRIANRYPAGYIEVKGLFLKSNPDEVLELIGETAAQATADHPMERIMEVVHDGEDILITTTGIIIAQRIGEALAQKYGGNLNVQCANDEEFVRVFLEP